MADGVPGTIMRTASSVSNDPIEEIPRGAFRPSQDGFLFTDLPAAPELKAYD